MVWYGMVWYSLVWCGVEWYGMVWYGIAIGNARKDKCECEAREHETNYTTPQIECALFLTIPKPGIPSILYNIEASPEL